jgi:hypothetical protein
MHVGAASLPLVNTHALPTRRMKLGTSLLCTLCSCVIIRRRCSVIQLLKQPIVSNKCNCCLDIKGSLHLKAPLQSSCSTTACSEKVRGLYQIHFTMARYLLAVIACAVLWDIQRHTLRECYIPSFLDSR